MANDNSNESKDRRITIRLPETLASEIDTHLDNSGMSFTEFLRRACREKLDREDRKHPNPIVQEDLHTAIRAELVAMMEDGTYARMVAEERARYEKRGGE